MQPQVTPRWEGSRPLGCWGEESQWKAQGWASPKAPAAWLPGWLGGTAGTGEAGSTELILEGPVAPESCLETQEFVEAWQ